MDSVSDGTLDKIVLKMVFNDFNYSKFPTGALIKLSLSLPMYILNEFKNLHFLLNASDIKINIITINDLILPG